MWLPTEKMISTLISGSAGVAIEHKKHPKFVSFVAGEGKIYDIRVMNNYCFAVGLAKFNHLFILCALLFAFLK